MLSLAENYQLASQLDFHVCKFLGVRNNTTTEPEHVSRVPSQNACYGLDVTKHHAGFAFDKHRSSLSSIQITPWSERDKECRLLVTNGSHEREDGIGN